MFTGIIRTLGTVKTIQPQGGGCRLRIECDLDSLSERTLSAGASVAVNGVCLTATEIEKNGFWTDLSEETLSKSTFKECSEGDRLNLEPSLAVGDEIGGHFVFGHVDSTLLVRKLINRGEFHELVVGIPEDYRPFIAEKGSVALDGISLTVNQFERNEATVRIIPHTYEKTRIHALEPGMKMNLEVDMLARYVYTSLHSD